MEFFAIIPRDIICTGFSVIVIGPHCMEKKNKNQKCVIHQQNDVTPVYTYNNIPTSTCPGAEGPQKINVCSVESG